MSYTLHLSYDTSRPAHRADAYKVSIVQTDRLPHALRQIGPVYNGIVHYRGVYATRDAAHRAASDYRKA